jgi:hypothetical protein
LRSCAPPPSSRISAHHRTSTSEVRVSSRDVCHHALYLAIRGSGGLLSRNEPLHQQESFFLYDIFH